MKEIREIINYRQNQFDEPTVPDIWQDIHIRINEFSFYELIESYIDDDQLLFCFQKEHAILALPIKKALITNQELKSNGIGINLTDDEINYFHERITNDTSGSRKTKLEQLILWNID